MKKVVSDFIKICASIGNRLVLLSGAHRTHANVSNQRKIKIKMKCKQNASLPIPFFFRGKFSDEQAPIDRITCVSVGCVQVSVRFGEIHMTRCRIFGISQLCALYSDLIGPQMC